MTPARYSGSAHHARITTAGMMVLNAVCFATGFCDCFAQPSREPSPGIQFSEAVAAQLSLLRAELNFSDGALGEYDGPLPPIAAMQTLLDEPPAIADSAFKYLLSDPGVTLAGRLYGLCGIYFTDSAYFEKVIAGYRNSTDRVRWHSGCTFGEVAVGQLISSTEGKLCIADGSVPQSIWRSWKFMSQDTLRPRQ